MNELLNKVSLMFSKKTMQKDVFSTSFLVVIGRGIGFLIPFVIAASFGMTRQTDAFFLAYGIILYVQMVLGNVFETAIVPYVTEQKAKGEDIASFFGSVLVRTTAVLSVLVVILGLAGQPLMRHLASFDPETSRLGTHLVYEMAVILFLIAWTSALNGALNAVKSFHIAALSPGIRSLIAIAAILALKDRYGVHAIALGYIIGEFFRFVFSAYAYRKKIGNIRLGWALSEESEKFFRSVFIQTAAFSILSSLALINQFMAAQLGEGGITVLTYGERLRNIPFLLFFTGVLSVIFSHWSNEYSRADGSFSWQKNKRMILSLTLGAVLFSVLLVLIRHPLAALAVKRGAFPAGEVETVANIFSLLILGFPFDVLALLCIRLLIIHHKEVFYLTLSASRILTTVILNVILMNKIGVLGIALSTTAVNGVFALLLWRVLVQISGNSKREAAS